MSSLRARFDFALVAVLVSAIFFIWPFLSCSVFATEKIDINTASIDQLDQLEGIGAVYAQRIIDGRPYSSLDDLLRVKGIGPAILQKIKDQGLACVNCGAAQETSSNEALGPSDSPAPASVATASATPAPGYQYSQKIFINEFVPWPASGTKEWAELINLDSATINLSGWQIDDGNASTSPQTLPAETNIAPGEFLVISFNKSVLNNDADKIRLLWPDDQVVHTVAYNKAIQGQAVAKFDNGWLWTNQPTPGQTNKKSLAETTETVSLARTPANNAQITTIEDAVATPISAPARVAQATIKAPLATPQMNAAPIITGAPSNNMNLTAAASGATGTVKNNNYLALAGVVILALLSAGGLIYFRRQKSAPDLDGE